MSAAEGALGELLALMARLRDPVHGCPWDLEQTFATIAPYTIEEAYEVADAIERTDPTALRDELGDLLFQVVFHARMAEERGWFDFARIAQGITEKLIRRHPHVFSEASDDRSQPMSAARRGELARQWDEHKARERATAAHRAEGGQLAGIPRALPALTRAVKLGRRAAHVGFDWDRPEAVRGKVMEELHELDAAGNPQAVAEELEDFLFAISNWARHLKVDPEGALRAANAKFERRFACMESLARERGLDLGSLSAEAWEGLWAEAKDRAGPA